MLLFEVHLRHGDVHQQRLLLEQKIEILSPCELLLYAEMSDDGSFTDRAGHLDRVLAPN